jgi:O-succinylbenzoic acid--CoA ligase
VSSLWPVRGSAEEIHALLREWDAAPRAEPLVVETSGSTGEPKRVLLSRAAMRASADATHRRLGGPGQWWLTLPPSYVAGLQVLFRSVRAGTTPVDDAASLSHERRYVSLVPTQMSRMLDTDASTLQGFDTVLIGGARMEPQLRERADKAGVRVVTTYGMSETCGGCVYDGRPLNGVKVSTSDDGRIRIRGSVLFDGYQGDDGSPLQDGWFVTQDLGHVDEDGTLTVEGRVDDVIVSGGLNVPAAAVAQRLRDHPGVREAEVVGVPDDDWGQQAVAVIVGDPGLDELRDWVAREHPRAWAPRSVVPVEELPLLPNGKVDRLAVEHIAQTARR